MNSGNLNGTSPDDQIFDHHLDLSTWDKPISLAIIVGQIYELRTFWWNRSWWVDHRSQLWDKYKTLATCDSEQLNWSHETSACLKHLRQIFIFGHNRRSKSRKLWIYYQRPRNASSSISHEAEKATLSNSYSAVPSICHQRTFTPTGRRLRCQIARLSNIVSPITPSTTVVSLFRCTAQNTHTHLFVIPQRTHSQCAIK